MRFWRWRRYRRPSREHLGSGEVIENWNIPSANARYIQPDHCGGTSPRVVVSAMIVVISGVVAARAVTRALHSSIAKSSMLAPCPSDTAALRRAQQRASHTLKAETPRHAAPAILSSARKTDTKTSVSVVLVPDSNRMISYLQFPLPLQINVFNITRNILI